MVQKLIHEFENLTEPEKLSFLKNIMPSVRELFGRDPQRMMHEMMPACAEMMKGCGMDMREMMKMMEAMSMKSQAHKG